MTRIVFRFVFLPLSLSCPALAQEPVALPTATPAPVTEVATTPTPAPSPTSGPKTALFELEGAIWYMPTTSWEGKTAPSQDGGGNLKYIINNSPFTTYEGGIVNLKTGISLGVSVDVDSNLVGKLNKFMGYVGYHGFFIRVQTATLKGKADWQGKVLTGQPLSYDVDTPYQNIQLIRAFNESRETFWGIGYSTVNLPQQMSVWGDINKVYTNYDSVDQRSQMKFYSLLFGFDTLNWASIKKNDGLGFWCFTQDMLGFGSQSVDPAIEQRIKTFYSGRTIPTTLTATLIDYNLTLGAKWEKRFASNGLGVGLGYNFHGMLMMSGWNARGSGNDDLNAYSTTLVAGYGPEFKLIGTW